MVVGGKVVVVVPESVSVSISVVTGQVVVYSELVTTVVEPMWHFEWVGGQEVMVYVILVQTVVVVYFVEVLNVLVVRVGGEVGGGGGMGQIVV